MKKVEAIIKPFRLDEVRDALEELDGLSGMSVIDMRGGGRQKGRTAPYEAESVVMEFVPKVKIELVVRDDLVDSVVACIMRTAYSGRVGDGKIFVSNIENAFRIRTGEKDENAV